MAIRQICAGAVAKLTSHGKRLCAESMYSKGKAFLAAAVLLRQHGGSEFVALHLVCQGIEIVLKGLLLLQDYDTYQPKLRKYGHDLSRIAIHVLSAFQLNPLRPRLAAELQLLSSLYGKHLL